MKKTTMALLGIAGAIGLYWLYTNQSLAQQTMAIAAQPENVIVPPTITSPINQTYYVTSFGSINFPELGGAPTQTLEGGITSQFQPGGQNVVV